MIYDSDQSQAKPQLALEALAFVLQVEELQTVAL